MNKYKLKGHQHYALELMASNTELGIFYAPGTGKTMIALSWVKYALKQGLIKDALVVCPAGLVGMWYQALDELPLFEGFDQRTIDNIRNAITITSFQKTWNSEKKFVGYDNYGYEKYQKVVKLRDWVDKSWGAIIIDESHSIGAHDSNQTATAITLGKLARYRFAMTGTPVHGGGGVEDFSKLYGQLQFLTKGTAFKNWTAFCRECVTGYNSWRKPVSYNTKHCRALLQEHGIVCRLEDCIDMPGKTEQMVACPLSEKKVYDDICDGRLEPYGIDIDIAGGQYIKMLQICSGSMKIDDKKTLGLKCSKDGALGDILNGTDDAVVVFCTYRASVDRCVKIGKKAGRKVVSFDGRSKRETWKDFQDGKADMIVCQYQAGSAGLNLQRSHTMVFFEPNTSALIMEQAQGRIYRSGQDKKCIYYYLHTPKTIEEKVLKTVKSGVDVTNDMLRRWSEGELFE